MDQKNSSFYKAENCPTLGRFIFKDFPLCSDGNQSPAWITFILAVLLSLNGIKLVVLEVMWFVLMLIDDERLINGQTDRQMNYIK